MAIGQELLNVPMGEMIYSMASSIARSQIELDRASIEVAEMMGGLKTVTNDQGGVTYTDSRVFFGHEYMTVGEAMVMHGDGNPAVAALIGPASISYKTYTTPSATITTAEDPAMGPPSENSHVLTQKTLKDYQKNAQAIRARIGYYEDLIVAERAKTGSPAPDAAKITTYEAYITTLKTTETFNSRSVSTVLARQIQVPTRLSLLELGFTPTFYQFIDTIIEVKIAITITQETSSQVTTQTDTKTNSVGIAFKFTPFGKGKANYSRSVQTAQVNGTYGSKYSHTAEGSSLLRTKLAPLPPPAILEERIRAIMAADQAQKAAMLALMTGAAIGTA